jgi:hypothetical protein
MNVVRVVHPVIERHGRRTDDYSVAPDPAGRVGAHGCKPV